MRLWAGYTRPRFMPLDNPPPLASSDIHVWSTSLSVDSSIHDRLEQLLSHDEIARANRFKFHQDRARFVVARGVLRVLLAHYAEIPATALCFEVNQFGKPRLVTPTHLHFNVTHSQDIALYAIAHVDVGIDVEQVRPMPDALDIARSFFRPEEVEALMAMPTDEQVRTFFRTWVRKEAYSKATGEGLSASLDAIHVRPGEMGYWELLDDHYHVQELPMHDNWLCALAARQAAQQIHRFAY